MNMLDGLQILYIYRKVISPGTGLKKIMEEKYNQFNNIVNRQFILDKDDVVTVILAQSAQTFL